MIRQTLASLVLVPLAFVLTAGARAEAPAVPTVRIEARAVALAHPAEATLEAVHQATLAAQVQGRVMELRVDAGDRAEKGVMLLRIDATEASEAVAGAEAQVAQAEANLVNAKAAYERSRSLVERGFVSRSALDQTRAAFEAAEAQLRAARAGRGQAATAKGYSVIVAPFDGVVAARHVELGEMAQPGRSLVTLYDPAAMRAVADIPQHRLAGLSGDALRARVELAESGRWLDAAALTILPAADPRTHTIRLRVDLPPGEAGLVPGMFARVHLLAGEADRLTVPASAILRRGEVTGVYVADGDGSFRLRQIRAGEPLADGSVEVLAGLAGGEEVALDPVAAGIVARGSRAAGR